MKNSIKRAQSQACLGFAEQKNFRPLAKLKKLSLTLALLITVAAGAWAQDPVAKDIVVSPESGTNISDAIDDALGTNGDWALNITINLAKGGTYTVTKPIAPSASITINGNGATIDAKEFTDHFIKMRKTPSYDKVQSGQYVVTTPSKIENVTITGLTKSLFYDNGAPYLFKDFTFNNCLINYSVQMNIIMNFAASTVINFTITNSSFYILDKYQSGANCIAMSGKRPWQVTGFEDTEGKLIVDHNTFYNVAYKKQFFNTNTLKGQNKYKYEFNSNIFVNVSNKKIYGNLTNNKNQVTTDGKNTYLWDGTFFSETNYNGDEGLQSDPLFKDAANGDFTLDRSSLQYKNNTGDPLWFNPKVTINDNQTEASFEMPADDVTATYTIKRDMTVDVAGEMAYSRIRIKKDGNDYQPVGADGNVDANAALPAVTDNLDAEAPVDMMKDKDYTLTLQKQGDTEDDWTDVTGYSVGTFRYKITGAGNYSGICYSEEFALFEGYEIKVAAGEYATFYKDEPLYADTETSADAVLYTVSSVSADKAVLSSAITTAPSLTPLLVFNSSEETKTFLLIPANEEPNLALTVAPEFKGTLEATTIAASTDEQNNYALNGKQFVWVKNALPVAANKAWLAVPVSTSNARKLVIVFDETTGIDAANSQQPTANSYYDLSGRKLNAVPTKKGVYILNGRKVVIK